MVCIHHAFRILYPAACIQFQGMAVGSRCHNMGFLVLFLHHHCSRTYMEVCHIGIYPADYSRNGIGISWKVSCGSIADSSVRGIADKGKPSADELLLPVCDAVYGSGLLCHGLQREETEGLLQGLGCACACRSSRRMCESLDSVSHLSVQQGEYARQERTR